MYRIFLGFCFILMLLFVATLWTGHIKSEKPQSNLDHFSSGLFTCIFGVGLHTLVIIYFVGTGRTIKAAIQDIQLPQAFLARSNEWYHSRGFLFAGLSCVFLVTTLVLGGALDSGRRSLLWGHTIFAYFTVFFNVFTWYYEYPFIKRNNQLLRDIDTFLEKNPVPKGPLPPPVGEIKPPMPFLLGQKLVFYGVTILFPYVFLKQGWGWDRLSFWPFLVLCLLLIVPGIVLKIRYRPSTWMPPRTVSKS